MSFTTGGLFYRESLTVAELYIQRKAWAQVRKDVLSANLLQARTAASAQRVYREVSIRLQLLTSDQMMILQDGSRDEQNYILWLAICKRFAFIKKFAVEVLREKFLSLDFELSYQDYQAFFNAQAQWHEELEQLKETTQKKLRQVLFKMMHEAELITKDNTIIAATLSPRVVNAILDDPQASLSVFPVLDSNIGG